MQTKSNREWYAGLWNPQLYEPTKCLFKYIKSTIENTEGKIIRWINSTPDNVVVFCRFGLWI